MWPALAAIASDLARQILHGEKASDDVKARAARARKQLQLIAEGKWALLDEDGQVVARLSGDSAARTFGDDAAFTRRNW